MKLYIRDIHGNYAPATAEQVLQSAKHTINSRYRRGSMFDSPSVAKEYFKTHLGAEPVEHFCVAYLDNRHRLITCIDHFTGTIDGASVYPRNIVAEALKQNAAAVVLAHNHPSGISDPSDADKRITARLRDALALVDVRVLDHIIVGEDSFAFSEYGLI